MANWHATITPLTIVELIIKLIAVGTGVAALSSVSSTVFQMSGIRIAISVFLCVIMAMYLVIFVQRVANDKNLIHVVFSVLQVLGHVVMIISSFTSLNPNNFFFVYSFIYVLGEYVRLLAMKVENVGETMEADSWFPIQVLYGISLFQLVVYLIIMAMALFLLITEY
jgi:hypothetical protein